MLLSSNIYAQRKRLSTKKIYTSGEIHLKNGDSFNCEIGFPIFNAADAHLFNLKKSKDHKYVFIKRNGKIEKIDPKEIEYLIATSNSQKIEIKYAEVFRYVPKTGEKKSYNFYYWLDFVEGCESIKAYNLVNGYDITNKGELIAIYLDKVAEYILLQEGGDHTKVGLIDIKHNPEGKKQWNKERRQLLNKYFENNPDGMEFLNNKKSISPKELSQYIQSKCK